MFQAYKSRLRRTKSDRYLFSLFVFTWHGAEKGADRFYAWPHALFHLKIRFYVFFSICTYTNTLLFKNSSTFFSNK
ncbi:hypothetical protein CON70_01945 [Bacillus pseudomycoides]|nr:hypothetical protein CON70_01945 [Bacillus pseudomycoides]